MNEIVIVNNKEYKCTSASELHYLYFRFKDKTAEEVKEIFTDATNLKIADKDGSVFGTYENLKLVSVEEVVGSKTDEDGTTSIIAKLYIKTQLEADVDTLKVTQDEQDTIIAEMMFGEGEE